MIDHTQGPWTADYYEGHVSFAIPSVPDDYGFRIEFHQSIETDEAENYEGKAKVCRLIEAAPDMLLALRRISAFAGAAGDDTVKAIAEAAIKGAVPASIAAATGQSD